MKHENLAHIKEKFAEKTGVCLTTQCRAARPLKRIALTAAAVLGCLVISAMAASRLSGSALIPFLQTGGAAGSAPQSEASEPLSEAQRLTIDRCTTNIGQTRTAGGAAVTLQTVTAAATRAHLIGYCVLEIEAPAGSWQADGSEDLSFERYRCQLLSGGEQDSSTSWLRVFDDAQGRSNFRTVVLAMLVEAPEEGRSLQLRIDLENFRSGDTLVCSGSWSFEVPLEPQGGLSLLEQPVALCGGERSLTALELTPLGGSLTVCLPALPRGQWQPERLRFSDGSTVAIHLQGGTLDEAAGTECLSFTLAAPADLTQAVAVEFADGTCVPLP